MKTLDIVFVVLMTPLVILLLYCFYKVYRVNRVYKFRIWVINYCPNELYWRLPDFDVMVSSFKPLSLKYWVSKELLSKYNVTKFKP